MANFDFGNTPITSDITLKAGWCCENSAENDITSISPTVKNTAIYTNLNNNKTDIIVL